MCKGGDQEAGWLSRQRTPSADGGDRPAGKGELKWDSHLALGDQESGKARV